MQKSPVRLRYTPPTCSILRFAFFILHLPGFRIFIPAILAFIVFLTDDLAGQSICEKATQGVLNDAGHQASRWYFGEYAGLDFRQGNPVADLSNDWINAITSPAIISDSAGGILFFTNGRWVFNRLGDTMPNGTGLHGFPGYPMPALIVPKPGCDSIYYIFTSHRPKQNPEDPQTIYGLEYNEVNMNLDSGLGDITIKNNVLLEPEVSSKLSGTKHSNGIDYWVVAHRFNSNEFCAFRVTQDGVDTAGYVSSFIGTPHLGPGETNNGIGYMKISPDGTKIALAIFGSDICEVFDFDASTGVVSNVITSEPVFDELFGVEFSPDSRFLYLTITSVSLPTPAYTPPSYLFQMDMNAGTSIFEPGSFDTIAFDTTGSYFGGIQLGPDGRIYVSRSPYGNSVISVIQNPKRKGSACNFISNAIDLQGRHSRFGFPNFIQSWFDLPHFSANSTGNNFEYAFTLQDDSNIDEILWDFGDPGSSQNTSADFQPLHVFSSEGTYEVSVTEYAGRTAYGPYTETIVIPSTSGIDDAVDVSGFCKVYPNPGNGDLRIIFDENQKRVMISVKNSLGHHLLGPVSYNNLAEDSEVFLDISELGNGIFFILFQNEEGDNFTIKYLLREE